MRIKETQATKRAQGARLDRPPGTIQASKFDKYRERIEKLLSLGLSVTKIAQMTGQGNHVGLNTRETKREIRSSIDL